MSEHWVPPDASLVIESGCVNQHERSTQSPRARCWDSRQYKFIFYSKPNCSGRHHRGLSCSNSFDWLCYGNQKNKSTLFSHLSVPQVLLVGLTHSSQNQKPLEAWPQTDQRRHRLETVSAIRLFPIVELCLSVV